MAVGETAFFAHFIVCGIGNCAMAFSTIERAVRSLDNDRLVFGRHEIIHNADMCSVGCDTAAEPIIGQDISCWFEYRAFCDKSAGILFFSCIVRQNDVVAGVGTPQLHGEIAERQCCRGRIRQRLMIFEVAGSFQEFHRVVFPFVY